MSIQFFKQTIAVLASASDINGALGVIEVASPSGAVPPLHVHEREDEAFFEEVAAIAKPSADPRQELGRLTAVAARYGVELLGPPQAPS